MCNKAPTSKGRGGAQYESGPSHSERVYGIMMRQEQQYKAGGIPIPFLALPLPLFVTRVSAGARACGR